MNYIAEVKKIIENKKAYVRTFGCQLNENDGEKLQGLLEEMGYGITENPEEADFVLLNTCAIRENAEKKTFGAIGVFKHYKEKKPGLVVAMSGCMTGEAHVVERLRTVYRHVDIVFGANNIEALPRLLFQHLTENRRVFDIEYDESFVPEHLPTKHASTFKAGVPVMYGCNNFCTYCIVPYVRGRERSRDEADILEEIRMLRDSGYKEIMLLGQNVNSYRGGGEAFADLLEKVSDTGIPRIRFMTSHPKDLNPAVLRVMAARENICKCLHLPVQAGNNRVLESMNRRYTREKYLTIVDEARRLMPGIALTTDIIVGFPGETTKEFEDTLSLLEEVRYDSIFSFIFSPRKGTPAEKMPDVLTEKEKKENFDRLLEVQNRISGEINSTYLGRELKILVEGPSKTDRNMMTGRSEGGKIVNFSGDTSIVGRFVDVKITETKTWNLQGEAICR
ncbi:MAG: tRNA (N6-isopentenyl adenosine(37)-C2)-methylthiotransferase MiaB [Clostridia bacterium]|nr:tRNA (N6-isopentenyl adenosine(37)-C2)-methylthiotransferase MiaB [Clostridia bacterium]